MATTDESNEGNVPNGSFGDIQQRNGIGTEAQDTSLAPGMATYPQLEDGSNSSGRKNGGLPNVAEVSGASKELWFPPSEIKRMLRDHLRSASRPCRTFYHSVLKDAPNPGLIVKGSGPVAFPFLDRDIKSIIKASELLGSEKENEETPPAKTAPAKTAPAKTAWELPFDMIELNNPSWERLIATVLSSISSELEIGPTGRGIIATRPSLLLYGPNSMVNPLSLSPQPPIFGFLDITLPSKYTGGDLLVEHDGRKEPVPLVESSEYDCSCLAWFSNVILNSTPISEGHRLVLRYTLEHRLAGPTCCAIPRSQEVLKLKSILTSWTKQRERIAHKVLAYGLNDKYEDAQLVHIKFSNSDQLAVTQLIEACAEAGVFLSLSIVTARIASQKDDDNSSKATQRKKLPSNSFQLGRIVDLDGKELLGDYRMDFKEADIVQDRPCGDDDYVADEDPEEVNDIVIKLFRKTVLVMLPLETRVSFLYGPSAPDYNDRVKEVLAHFCSLSKSAEEFVRLGNVIREICDAVLMTVSWHLERGFSFVGSYSREVQSYVLKAIQLLGDKALLRRALPIGFASADDFQILSSAGKIIGPNWLKSNLSQQIAETTEFLGKLFIIGRIERLISDDAWVNSQYESAMMGLKFSTYGDIEGVVKAAAYWHSDNKLQTIFIPSIKKSLVGNEMVLSLLSQLTAAKQIPTSVFEELVPLSIEHFTVEKERTRFHEAMSKILLHCHFLGLSMPFHQAITRISHAASKATLEELENDYLRFLGEFIATIDKTSCMSLPVVQGLYQHVMNLIALNCAPIKNKWVLSRCGCGCRNCNELDAFLENHLVDTVQFYRNAEERNHLELRLRTSHPTRIRSVTVMAPDPPYMLRVTKVMGPNDSPIQYWFKKHEAISASIASLGTKRLRQLLEGYYADLVSLKPIHFSPIIFSHVAEPQVVDLTAGDERPSSIISVPVSEIPGHILGSNSHSKPFSQAVPPRFTSNHNMSTTASFSTSNQHRPSQNLATATLSTPIRAHNDRASGQILSSSQPSESPAIVAQAIVRPTPSRQNSLQRSAANATPPVGSSGTQSTGSIVKTEISASSSRQKSSMQRPGGVRNPDIVAPVSAGSPRTLSPLGPSATQPNGNLTNSKRKKPPISVEWSSSRLPSSDVSKRPRVEESIAGGVHGSVDAPPPPLPENHIPPRPPAWLIKCLAGLEPRFPGHLFKAIMRHIPVDSESKMPYADPAFGYSVPSNVSYMWIPRIQCDDCPGKLYIPGSGRSVTNFVIHLKSQMHASNVRSRLQLPFS